MINIAHFSKNIGRRRELAHQLTVPLFWLLERLCSEPERGSTRKGASPLSGQMMAARTCLVHISAVQRAGTDYLSEGARVTFDIVDNRGNPVAYNLRVK
jgi:hypothetical protein